MLNFLPEQQQKVIRRMYRARLLSVILSFISVSAVIALLLLVPSYYLSLKQAQAVAMQHGQVVGKAIPQDEAAMASLHSLKESLRSLDGLKATYPTDVLDVVLDARPSSVRLERIRYTEKDDDIALVIGGIAQTRGDLLTFKDALARTPRIVDVSLPIDFLARETDVVFQISFTYNLDKG